MFGKKTVDSVMKPLLNDIDQLGQVTENQNAMAERREQIAKTAEADMHAHRAEADRAAALRQKL